MGSHRADRRSTRPSPATAREACTPEAKKYTGRQATVAAAAPQVQGYVGYPVAQVREDEATSFGDFDRTEQLPLVSAEPGKRRAVRSPRRAPLVRALPSAPMLAGVAVLAVAAGGAVTAGQPTVAAASNISAAAADVVRPAGALTGVSAVGSVSSRERTEVVSRDSRRDALADTADEELVEQAEAQARQRNAALANLAQQAEQQAAKLELNAWVLPVSGYRLTATFGQSSGLWSSTHTGLDFAAPSGTPLVAVANGTITSTAYDGSYGNKTVLTLEDGTEIWYCHQTSFAVSPGQTVRAGEVIGSVGSTGNSTGPHLHLEVRPGAGDPVDPYQALVVRGLQP